MLTCLQPQSGSRIIRLDRLSRISRHFSLLPSRPPTQSSSQSWEQDERFQEHKRLPQGMQRKQDLRVGPYRRNKFWASPREDPWTFMMNVMIIGVTLYTIANLTPGELFHVRRKRILRERLLSEYGLTEADLDDLGPDAPLSESDSIVIPSSQSD